MKTWMKTVVGLFKTRNEAQFAINDLINCGVQQDAITLRSGNVEHHVWSEEEETDFEKVKGNEEQVNVQQDVVRLVGRGNARETGVHVGRGDIAALTDLGISESDARYYSERIGRGGYLLTVVVNNDRAEETAEIIQRHGAVEDGHGIFGFGRGRTAEAGSLEQSVRPRVSPEYEPLAHDTLSEQLERAEVFKDREEVAADLAGRHVQQFVGTEVSLPSANIFGERDILRFEAQQRELQDVKLQKR
ncbi:general stress protein [Geomonas sp. Red32]|uniref:general stress protein n=1 Tax=Geomonas sp. Red32 TaxID=2912856 RepID=UPI00202CAACD|nr:general stress protein [Geomonas sp. Red32]MCM0080190.1 general stress protein [Geomonas sp. Red32]